MTHLPRPFLASAAAACGALLIAGCSSGPFAKADGGRYFQYLSPDDKVAAEYTTADAATCRQHLANLKRGNTHMGGEATRCSATSAAASLPVSAAATDPSRVDYTFRFATREQCQRMMPAIATGATVTRNCT